MISYFSTRDSSKCCGCKACLNVCPKHAIQFKKDDEGFVYPVIQEDRCVNCNACAKVCPYDSGVLKQKPIDIYALQNLNDDVLFNSSSGGMFRLLADYVIDHGGYVVGAIFSKDYAVELAISNERSIIEKMMGSKYVYSDPKDIYKKTKEKLEKGFYVLFSGSPCQCAALKNFLKRDYNTLITADFLCHGMPSSSAFMYYLDTIKKKNETIYDIRFRDKSKKGLSMAFSYYQGGKKYISLESTNPYLFAFQSGLLNRYSCYECPFVGENRFTDFTFSDYWGVERFHPEIDQRKGVSAVSINTSKAQAIKEVLESKAIWVQTKRENVAVDNPAIMFESLHNNVPELRKTIFQKIKCIGWKKCSKLYFRPKHYYLKKVWYSLPRGITKRIKKYVR